ncbi:unnamed protein product [Sphenostylis stenocarpa]|uniref:Uncharacterized protein n=1 Tax=Sphenostylis stenocarpa TaxID=92480 RepID=A0AA86VTP8_9FABA|nr:unnamed protein product [Sphenostylis stenocarpa]
MLVTHNSTKGVDGKTRHKAMKDALATWDVMEEALGRHDTVEETSATRKAIEKVLVACDTGGEDASVTRNSREG